MYVYKYNVHCTYTYTYTRFTLANLLKTGTVELRKLPCNHNLTYVTITNTIHLPSKGRLRRQVFFYLYGLFEIKRFETKRFET